MPTRRTATASELDFEAYITDNFLVTIGASYNDTEIDDPDLAVQVLRRRMHRPRSDRRTRISAVRARDREHRRQPPAAVARSGSRTSRRAGACRSASGEFYVYTDWAYRSEVNFFLYESAEFEGEELLEGGLRIGYNWNDGKHEVAVFGRNITDEIEAVGGIDFNNLTGFVNEPRRYGVEFRTSF